MRLAIFFFLLLLGLESSSSAASDISGKVFFDGAAPESVKLDMKMDPACAKLYSGPVFSEEALVSSDGGLKNVFVYVKEGLEGRSFPAAETPVVLNQEGCRYSPRVFGIQTGQILELTNRDATIHNVRATAKEQKSFNLGMPMKQMKMTRQFEKQEVMVPFKCDVHPWMRAYAGVLDHPFFAVTDESGAFTLRGLPAGDYTLEAWHEKFGTRPLKITVTEGAETPAAEFRFSAS